MFFLYHFFLKILFLKSTCGHNESKNICITFVKRKNQSNIFVSNIPSYTAIFVQNNAAHLLIMQAIEETQIHISLSPKRNIDSEYIGPFRIGQCMINNQN